MEWFEPLDLYCERIGPSFWAEPVNAISNAAFLVAAATAEMQLRVKDEPDLPARLLAALVGIIGIGSFLFHTFADRWSVIADVAPITLFIIGYFFLAMRRFLGLSLLVAGLLTAAFMAASGPLGGALRPVLGSTAGYFPALLAIVVVGLVLLPRSRRAGEALLVTGAVFAASMGFRMADLAFCNVLPLGTHFMWHVLNAVTLYLLLRLAIRVGPAGLSPATPAAGGPTGKHV